MNRKYFITAGLALSMVFFIAAQSAAQSNGRMWCRSYGPMMSEPGGGYYSGQALTTSQQDKANKIEEKYRAKLTKKETAIREKAAELKASEEKDSTTLGEANNLRDELYAIEKDYWALRNNVNLKISKALGRSSYRNMGCEFGNCSWHDDHPGRYATASMYSQRGPARDYGCGCGRCW